MAWLAPVAAAGAEADRVPEEVVVATPEPPEVACTVVLVPVVVPVAEAVVVWAAPPGRV